MGAEGTPADRKRTGAATKREHDALATWATAQGLTVPDVGAANLTVLTTQGLLATKRYTAVIGEKPEPPKLKHFRALPLRVDTADAMEVLLRRLQDAPCSLLILDPPHARLNLSGPVRRLADDFQTDAGRDWLGLDIDGAALPAGMDPTSLAACEYVRQRLPLEVRNAEIVGHFTASAGLQEKAGAAHLRFYLRLSKPALGTTLLAWAKMVNREVQAAQTEQAEETDSGQPVSPRGVVELDASLFHKVQIHYTAPPVFDGRGDPFEGRSRLFRLSGKAAHVDADSIERLAAIPEEPKAADMSGPVRPSELPPGAYALNFIGDDGLGLHEAINRAVWQRAQAWGESASGNQLKQLARELREKALTEYERGNLSGRSKEYIKQETSSDAIRRSFHGAIQKGAAIRLPPGQGTGFDKAFARLRKVASGRRKPEAGYTVQDYAFAAAIAARGRLGAAFDATELLTLLEDAAGARLHPAIRARLRDHYATQQQSFRRAHCLGADPRIRVQRVESLEEIRVGHGAPVFVRAPFGAGKTKHLGRRFVDANPAAVIVTHRRSLARGNAGRLGVVCYRDREGMRNAQPLFEGVSTVVNSLTRADVSALADWGDGVIVDEAEQVVRHLTGGAVPDSQREAITAELQKLFTNGKRPALFLDANLDDYAVVAWCELFGWPLDAVEVYELTRPREGTARILREASQGRAVVAVHQEALAILEAGGRPVIATDRKDFAESLHQLLVKDTGKKGGCVTADTSDKVGTALFGDPDGYPQQQGWDFLVYSPAIAAGVSFEAGHFTHILGLYSGVLTPLDFLQQLFRVRTAPDVTVAVLGSAPGQHYSQLQTRDALERLDREQHGDPDRTLDHLSELSAANTAREDADRAWHAVKLVAALEDTGMRVQRVSVKPLKAVPRELAEIRRELKAGRSEAILAAPILTPRKAQALRQRDDLDREDLDALQRFNACLALGLEEPEQLTSADLAFLDRRKHPGRVADAFEATRLERFEVLEHDRDQAAATRRFLKQQRALFRDALSALGVDPVTGTGEWTRQDALALAGVLERHGAIATKLGLSGTGKRPQETAKALLKRLGLKPRSKGSRRSLLYEIEPQSWEYMLRLMLLRSAARFGTPEEGSRASAELEALRRQLEALRREKVKRLFSEPDDPDETDCAPPAWLVQALKERPVFIASLSAIQDRFGVGRSTAQQRRKEALGGAQAVPGINRFTVVFGREAADRQPVTVLTYLDDPDRVAEEIAHMTGKTPVRPPALEAPGAVTGVLVGGRLGSRLLHKNSEPQTTTNQHTCETDENAPKSLKKQTTQQESPPITLLQVQKQAGMTSARADREVKRGQKHLRNLLSRPQPESFRRWARQPDPEVQRLIDLAMGVSNGDPRAAQQWVRDHVR
ncbi:MAG: hypothetical protein WED00_08450 [Aquisalimonadaceae bacterium]